MNVALSAQERIPLNGMIIGSPSMVRLKGVLQKYNQELQQRMDRRNNQLRLYGNSYSLRGKYQAYRFQIYNFYMSYYGEAYLNHIDLVHFEVTFGRVFSF